MRAIIATDSCREIGVHPYGVVYATKKRGSGPVRECGQEITLKNGQTRNIFPRHTNFLVVNGTAKFTYAIVIITALARFVGPVVTGWATMKESANYQTHTPQQSEVEQNNQRRETHVTR